MEQDDRLFMRDFFRAVSDRALEPNSPKYVPIYEEKDVATKDPVELLARGIEWTPGSSAQLLSGFRGTGKSTELRRLQRRLQKAGFLVILLDCEDHMNLTTPVDVSDFLLVLTGAVAEALTAPELLGTDVLKRSFSERIGSFLTQKVTVEELRLKPQVASFSALDVKASLKSDPTFKERLQHHMAGHLRELVEQSYELFKEATRKLKEKHGDAVEPVLLVDSMEHIRGTSTNAEEVHKSVETLFCSHADKLHIPNWHVVYTVPPFLKVRYANLGNLYGPGGLHTLPAIKLEEHETGERFEAGYDLLERVVTKRGDWRRLLGERQQLDRLIEKSGGQLRDLLRLIAEVLRRAGELPVDAVVVDAAIDQTRNEFLPIPDADALRLARVTETHRAPLGDKEQLADFAHYLDTHMVLCYRNGEEWYDVHPLIREVVVEQAQDVKAEQPDR